MCGLSAVTIAGEDSAPRRSRSASAVIPVTHLSARAVQAADSSRSEDSSALAITGIITLSSRLPAAPAKVTVASLPITVAQTWQTASQMTGLTLPGMIDE